jgi:hypothetical protein
MAKRQKKSQYPWTNSNGQIPKRHSCFARHRGIAILFWSLVIGLWSLGFEICDLGFFLRILRILRGSKFITIWCLKKLSSQPCTFLTSEVSINACWLHMAFVRCISGHCNLRVSSFEHHCKMHEIFMQNDG